MIRRVRGEFELLSLCRREFPVLFPFSIVIACLGMASEGIGIGLLLPLFAALSDSRMEGARGSVPRFVLEGTASLSVGAVMTLIVGLFLVKAILVFLSRVLAGTMTARWEERWYARLYDALVEAEYGHVLRHKIGSLTNTISAETDRFSWAAWNMVQLFAHVAAVVVYLAISTCIDPRVTMGTCVLAGGGYLCLWTIIRRGRDLGKMRIQAKEAVLHLLFESLSAIGILKAMQGLGPFQTKIKRLARQLGDVSIQRGVHESALHAAPEPIIVLMLCLVLFFGRTWFEIELATFIVLAALLYRTYTRIGPIPVLLHAINSLLPSYDAIDTLLQESRRARPRSGPEVHAWAETFRSLRMESVSFAYDDRNVLSQIDLEIGRGMKVAIVGPSGAGKSTLAGIILGLLGNYSGNVRINESSSLREIDLEDWRRRLGCVSQESHLFNATIEENVRLFGPYTPEAVQRALQRAHCTEFVADLPQGELTVIGDRGARLSGGQRQRIALARALIREPEILVLDEATSELDSESEERIRRTIAKLGPSVTVIQIAHRLSTIRSADRILVLECGRIVEEGSYDSLRVAGGCFERYVQLQDVSEGESGASRRGPSSE